MKTRRIFSAARLSFPLASALVALLAAPSANAATYYWDDNAAGALFGTAGASTGTWGAPTTGPTAGWSLSATGANAFAGFTTATSDAMNFGDATNSLGSGSITVGTVNSGNITVGAASGAITLTGGQITFGASTVTVNNATNTINSTLAGPNTLSKAGTGSLLLGGTNTRTGKLTISAGSISVSTIKNYGVAGGLGQQASTTIDQLGAGANTGTLIYTGALDSTNRQFLIGDATAANTGGATFINNGTGALTLNATNFNPAITGITATRTLTLGGTNTGANTIQGIIQENATVTTGKVALTKANAGTWVLSGANSYTGLTTISGGVLRITNNTSLGTVAGNVSLATGSGLEIDGTGGAVTVGAEAISIAGGGVTLPTPNLGAIRNIAGSNTYGGTVTMTAQSRINSDSGNLTLNNATAAVTGAFNLIAGGAGNITISTPMTNGTGGLTYDGTGTLVIGSAVNTFTGSIAVSGAGGALQMTSGSNGTATAAPLGIFAGGTGYKTVTLSNGGIFRPMASYNDNVPSASVPGNGYVFSIGTGGGTFDVPTGVGLTIDDGTGTGTATTAAQLQGSGTLTKTGVGTLSLGNGTSNFAAFTGAIIVNAGTLTTGATVSTTPFGTIAAGTTINSGAALSLGAVVMTAAEPLTINGTGLTSAPVGALTASGTATWIGPITLGSSATVGGGAGQLTVSSTINTAGNALTLRHSGTNQLTNGIISGSGNVIVGGSGVGVVGMSAASTYTGGTSLNSGNVAVGFSSTGTAGSPTDGPFGAGATPLILNGSQVRCGTGGPFTAGNTVTIAADTTFFTASSEKTLTFTGPVTLTANRTLTSTVGNTVAGTSVIFNGAIDDGASIFSLSKAGAGNLTLGAANTYEGGTTVNDGTLKLTGSLLSGTALTISPTVAGGAAFSLASGTANPLPNVSALSIGSATGPTSLSFDLGANTAASDSIITPNAATTTGTVNLNIMPLAGFGSASTYDLISASSGLGGATYVLTSAPGGYTYSLTPSASLVTLSVTPTTAGDLYWRGNNSNSWSAFSGANTNWYNGAAGSTNTQANPGAGDTVNFSTVNATNTVGAISTTLDNNFTVNDLVFGSDPNGVTSVTIAGGLTPSGASGILAIAPSVTSDGINVGSNAGSVTISAPVLLGAAQTWTVDGTGANGSSLTVSGPVTGAGNLGISGLVTLSAPAGSNTYSGATTVPNGGILVGTVANNLSASSAMNVTGTGILRLNGVSNTVLSLAGTGIVQNNHASTAAILTVGDATNTTFSGTLQNGGVGTLALTKAGAGILTLSGANTYTGGTIISTGTIQQGVANALPSGNALTVNGTSVFDLNGLNGSVSTLGGASTGIVTDNAAGSGTSTLSINAAATSAVNITNGATRTVALRVTNANGSFLLTNGANTFTGGIVLTNSVGGSRLAPGTITPGAYGTGAITIGESATDQAGIFFQTASQTLSNPIIVNTALGTDRVGIRTDAAGITLSGVITANLAPATFTSNTLTAGAFTLTNQVTGASGLVLDITSLSAAATTFQVTLNNTAGTNNYQGDTVVNFNAASGKSAILQLLAANQIPNGTGTGNVFVNSNATGIGLLSLAGGNETINGLNGSGNVASTSGTVTLTLGDNNATGSHSGAINNTAGTLSVTKIGSGTQTLSGASNFAGSLTVNGGLVVVPSSPATGGPLGNSTLVNLSGGGISHTASGANDFNRTIAIGASNGTVSVASATGVLNLNSLTTITSTGGNLVKTGSGTLLIPASTTLNGGSAGVVINEGTLRAGFGSAGIATASVGASGNLDLQNSAREALVLGASTGALTLTGGAQVGFELNGANTDSIAVAAGGTAVTSGVVTLNFFGTPAGGTYNLLTADSGLAGASYVLGSAPNGFNYTINASDTVVSVTVSAYIPTFWRGGQDLSWNTLGIGTANWTDSTGTVDAISKPLGTDTVIFSAAGVTPGAILTTLDAAFTVDSLQFSNIPGSSAVTIAAGTSGTLTLTPVSTSGGIRVLSGGGNATISAPLTIGAAQTWDVDPSGSLTISGDTTFTGSVNKTGTGVLTLSGNNSGAAAFTLSAGTLNLNSATAVGTGTFTIGAGTTINTAAANTLTNNNVQNWIGDFTFTGTNNLDLGAGAVTLGSSLILTTTAGTLTVGGNIGDGGNNRSLAKAGPGNLLLAGINTFVGGVTHNAGGLILANNSALGAGTLRINGGTVAANGTVATTNGVEANADFSIVGSGALTLGNIALSANRIITNTNTTATTTLGSVSGAAKTLTFSGNGNSIVGGINTTTGTLTKTGTGSLVLSGTSTYSGATTISGGTLNITGPLNGATTSAFAYGSSAANTIVNVSNNMTVGNITGANNAGSIAVYNQTAGSVSSTSSQFASYVANSGGYGYFNLTGGAFATTGGFNNTVNTGTASTGVAYIAANLDSSAAIGNMVVAYSDSSKGSLTVAPGGTLNYSGSVGSFFLTVSANSYGVLNIAGGDVNFGTRAARFGNTGANQTGFVNLAGGVFTLGQNFSTAATSENVYVNYAGGTLKASANLTNPFNPGGTVTTVSTIFGAIDNSAAVGNASQTFTGGLTVNTSGNSVTLANALLGATGSGVKQANIAVTGGTGYIGAPMVQFTGGTLATNGSPASGYAIVSGGAVTGIVITSPGEYTVAPTVTLTGGGGTGASVALSALTANAADTGLTKMGIGTLTLSGANTFTGATLVSGGKLQLDGSSAGAPTTSGITVGAGGTLGFTAAAASILDLTGKSMSLGGTLNFDVGGEGVNDAITVQDFTLTGNSALTFNSIGAIGGTYTLVSSANPITTGGFSLTGQTIGRTTLTPTINTSSITVSATLYEGRWNQTGGGNWSVGDPNMTAGNWDEYKPTITGDAALFGSAITAPSTVAVDTPHTVGFIRFDNANAYTIGSNGSSNLTINNGASNALIAVTSGSHTIAENVALLSNLVVTPVATTTLTMSGIVSGAKTVTMNDAGTLVLSGINTYTGATTVSNGVLTLSGNRTATMGAINVGNLASTTGTLNISAGTFTTGAMSVGNGANVLTSGIINQSGGTLTLSGNQLLLANGGTGTASGSNSTGTYNLSGGTLNTVASTVGVLIGTNAGTTGHFNLSGTGILNMAATSTMQIARSDNAAATNSTGTFSQTGGTAIVGILQMSGTTAAAVNGAGGNSTLALTGGTFTATTFNALSGGNGSSSTIAIGGSSQVTLPVFPTNVKGSGATASITFDSTSGFLSPAATSTTYLPAGTFTNAYLTANGANLNIPTGRDITIAQVFGDAPTFIGTLAKSGVGTLTLSAANTYTGLTTVNAGTINLGNIDALGTTAAGTTVASGGRVTFGTLTTASIVAEPFTITGTGTASNGALNFGSNKTINLSGAITLSGNASVSADGGSAFNFTSASGITGTDTNLTLQTDGSVANSITGPISLGTGSLTKSGTSTLTLSGDNAYSGGTTVTGGVLAITSTGDAGTGNISVAGAVRLELGAVTLANAINLGANATASGRGLVEGTNGITTLSGPISITVAPAAGGTFATTGAGTLLNLNGAITATPSTVPVSVRLGNVNFGGGGNYTDLRITGNVGLNADNGISTSAVMTVGASSTCVVDLKGFDQSLAGMVKGGSAGSVVNSTAATTSTLTLTSTLSSTNAVLLAGSGAGALAVTRAGSAVQTLSGVNTYTGPTTVTSGTLAAGVASVANVSGAFGKNSAVIMADAATAILDITGFNTQIGSLTGGGASGGNVNLGAAVLSVGGDNTSPAAYAGAIAGTGALTKIGTGTQVLSGANSYNGNTTVSAGTLALVGGSQASAITVSGGASLGFTLGSATTSTSTFDVTAGTIQITGTPTLPSYTLISASTGITGTPTLYTPIAGYALVKYGNVLKLETPYETWAAATGATGGKEADPDGDGIKNLVEYAFGTDPTVSSTAPLAYSGGVLTTTGQPILEENGGIYYAVFGRRTDYLTAGLTYTVQFSNALSTWTATVTAPTVVATDGTIDAVRVPFLNLVPSDSGPQKPTFFRVQVSQ